MRESCLLNMMVSMPERLWAVSYRATSASAGDGQRQRCDTSPHERRRHSPPLGKWPPVRWPSNARFFTAISRELPLQTSRSALLFSEKLAYIQLTRWFFIKHMNLASLLHRQCEYCDVMRSISTGAFDKCLTFDDGM